MSDNLLINSFMIQVIYVQALNHNINNTLNSDEENFDEYNLMFCGISKEKYWELDELLVIHQSNFCANG